MNWNIVPLQTWICLGVIALAFVVCLCLVLWFKAKDKLLANRRMVEYFPTLVSSLGVLGTFFGITMGLIAFDSQDLDTSIPGLLDGLKTAFFTSLAGMLGSMFLSAIINRKQDEKDGGVSDINQAAGTICQAVKQMSDLNASTMQALRQQLADSEADRKAFYRSMGDVMDTVKESQKAIKETLANMKTVQGSMSSAMDTIVIANRSQESALSDIRETSTGMAQAVGTIEEATAVQTEALKSMSRLATEISEDTHHIGEMHDIVEAISTGQDEISEKVGKMKDIIHGEVTEIEENMAKTNALLERKFDEFTELLKKSNTEALVEVMKKVTEEFQKQMNALINKLIQENFDQLNKSVEKLNQWQQENKEMIASLTKQYKEMAENFEATSASLTHVKEDTTSLVSEGGKLRQLIDALNKVIVEDERFIKLTAELHETAVLSKTNMESFDESTKALNEWVRKQKHFVDGVQALIAKLEELDKIRDYGEQFWKGTKEKMEEGVGIITNGSQTLNSQIKELDRQFYGRLSATLAELDNCITKMVEQVGKRR